MIIFHRINNLKIIKKSELIHDSKTHQSKNFQDKVWWLKDKFNDINNIIIKELPKHIIYYNGEIWNGTRFLTFSKSDNYLTCNAVKLSFCHFFSRQLSSLV